VKLSSCDFLADDAFIFVEIVISGMLLRFKYTRGRWSCYLLLFNDAAVQALFPFSYVAFALPLCILLVEFL